MTPSLDRRRLLATAAATAGLLPLAASKAAAAPTGPYRIDMHAHYLPPDYRKALLKAGYLTIGGYPTPTWSPEAALAFMDRYRIQTQVLSVSDPAVTFVKGATARNLARYCNDYAAALVKKHPKRFGALAVLPMPDVLASLAEIRHALDVLKLDGVGLISSYNGVYLGDPRFEPVMAELNRRGAYVFVHPAAPPPANKPELLIPDFLYEFTFDTTRAATAMIYSGTIKRYPKIRFQLAHAGGTVPFLANRLALLENVGLPDVVKPVLPDVSGNIRSFYYDTALSSAPSAMKSVLEVTSRDHIVFGSDWPFSALTLQGSGDPQPKLSETFTDPQRLKIERANALRQLPRLAALLTP
ncbi:amidohydrolase family protein [Actinocorallia sp. A-T 12471]|uniref:amidohydrolase family protein n=1 Tax=Actinocorallia sp. A-T 12471 TaxID=3089813 RepID=UPI0029CACE6A|nr:amidohydrolase family protein [Actinocorallia sp. A-T 12471]MDX6741647.1 amidohydrolase family protein [Actinocorallia sp. A-T 12471]